MWGSFILREALKWSNGSISLVEEKKRANLVIILKKSDHLIHSDRIEEIYIQSGYLQYVFELFVELFESLSETIVLREIW
jgi:hypothetical protein